MNMMPFATAPEPTLTRTEVSGLIALAARTVPPLWPLESAIAVNPLAGFEGMAFEEAVQAGARLFGARQSLPLAQWRALLAGGRIAEGCLRDAAIRHLGGTYPALAPIAPGITALDLLMARLLTLPATDEVKASPMAPDAAFVAKWCAAFFDHGHAAIPMPHRELGLYRAVLAMAGHDPEFHALTGTLGAQLLMTVPRDPLNAIAEALSALGIAEDGQQPHLAALVARLPGWAGHIRWRSEHADAEHAAGAPAGMADLLALWLLLERAGALTQPRITPQPANVTLHLAAHFGWSRDDVRRALAVAGAPLTRIATMDEEALGLLFMTAAEWTYADGLVPRLQAGTRAKAAEMPASEDAAAAQLVFCIDVRSEPFRRALETTGRYETLGYAGFFGLPIALHPSGAARRKRLLPVLLSPQHDVAEAPRPGHEPDATRLAAADATARHAASLFDTAKQGIATAFATAEATGPLAGLAMAARTLAPRLSARIGAWARPCRHEAFAPALDHASAGHAHPPFTLADKIGYASALFRLTGLPTDTARLVVLVGHGGSAVNNPYAAALDCGACGGHAGGSNARILAAMLNEADVRAGLVAQGIALPETTHFLAAEHNTTTDTVTIFDRTGVPAGHAADLARLEADLARAGAANRERRAGLLDRSPQDLLTGAAHWGEVRPEWGLSGNAGFLVGPRRWSKHIDLEGRAFLHSYDWRADADGSVLATILTAPMVVAQWINCQYLFSTIDNDRYGSGDKVTQNVIGRIGVVQGNGGDLAVGLPRQSLFRDDGSPFHLPQRLLTVVLAPLARVEAVVAANDILARLFGKGWVHLVVIAPETGQARRWRPDGAPQAEGTGLTDITA
ncbi:DUF2309 domain-containing protein [Novosphingobium humi]|uniref:Probable inorganic carbon transporter subunit DabA n=1 Tax=Novosphingobium humi TaxID=2282397 RepID=A0ABY7TUE4_9SPHN|nr:DUF2309 domain-containing protein [Novosphingobium humi]WCT76626.1 DUF2309 domain-containing protein [Novosphingobium humi]